MYFAKCFELRRRVAQAGAKLTTAAAAARTKAVAANARPGAKVDDDPREGKLTCMEDLPFIHFLHFVGQILVQERDDAKIKAMKRAQKKGGVRPAFRRSDVW